MWLRDHFHEIPALIVPCLEFDQKPDDTWRAGSGSGGSIWPADDELMFMVHAGMAGHESKRAFCLASLPPFKMPSI